MVSAMLSDSNLQRLRWQCRRGMLELDLLLTGFVERSAAGLDDAQLACFEYLLQQSDQLIYDWLFEHQVPTDREVIRLVKKIRTGTDT